MNLAAQKHPDLATLQAFVLGKLSLQEASAVETHLTTCDQCAQALSAAPDDTLVRLAREAATQSFKIGDTVREPVEPTVPAELADHPRYKIVGMLGTGGMGSVYKAEHRLMERIVAVKVISPAFTANPMAVERFRREVRAAARLAHPNIVTAFDAEQAGDLQLLVMEFVDGMSLDRLVARQGPLKASQACGLIRQAALGLAHAHEKGMIHRDIKPHNLMVTRKGQLKILDFGLARLYTERTAEANAPTNAGDNVDAKRTAAGIVLGTPDYMAPEQIRDSSSTDIRSDIYALGCTLYFLLTGRAPFGEGTLIDKLSSQLKSQPEPVNAFRDDVPSEVQAMLQRMMAKDPAERFQTPAELAQALAPLAKSTANASGGKSDPAMTGVTPEVSHQSPEPTAQPISRRGIGLLAAGAVVGVAMLAAGIAFATRGGGSSGKAGGSSNELNSNGAAAGMTSPANSATGHRVLFVVPSEQLWYADYAPTKQRLEAGGAKVTTASSRTGRLSLLRDPRHPNPPPIDADVALGDDVKASDYDAIVFGGYQITPFISQTREGETVGRLLREFADQRKPVAAICVGQAVLAQHHVLDGLPASGGKTLDENFPYHVPGGPEWTGSGVEVVEAGRIITARDDTHSTEFADAILNALRQPAAAASDK
jgi:eukaryotic-like serine/threonine-protein kinase